MKRTIRRIKKAGARTGKAVTREIDYNKKFFKAGLYKGMGYTIGVLGVKSLATLIK